MIIIVVIKVLPVINHDHYRGHQNTPVINHDHYRGHQSTVSSQVP